MAQRSVTRLVTRQASDPLSLQKAQLAAFQRQQLFFDWQAAAEAGQIAVAANDAMARDNNRNRIRTVRKSHRAGRRRIADSLRQLPVADGFSVRNFLQVAPDQKLKVGAVESERQIEVFELSVEIRIELANHFLERSFVLYPIRFRRLGPTPRRKM